jgi:hypothetical protein
VTNGSALLTTRNPHCKTTGHSQLRSQERSNTGKTPEKREIARKEKGREARKSEGWKNQATIGHAEKEAEKSQKS